MKENPFPIRASIGIIKATAIALFPFFTVASGIAQELAEDPRVQTGSYHFEMAGQDIEYSFFTPETYEKSSESALVIVLHDYESKPEEILSYACLIEEADNRGFLVVAPLGFNKRGWYGSRGKGKKGKRFGWMKDPENLGELSELDVLNVVKEMKKRFSIDEKRIYLMGHGMGADGALFLGSSRSINCAGMAVINPSYMTDASLLQEVENFPVMVIGTAVDEDITIEDVRSLGQKIGATSNAHHYLEVSRRGEDDSVAANSDMISHAFDFFEGKFAGQNATSGELFRIFTRKDGKTINARVIKHSDGNATLKRMRDLKEFTVPSSSLAVSDQAYLKTWSARQLELRSITELQEAINAEPDPELEAALIERLQIDLAKPKTALKALKKAITTRETKINALDDATSTAFQEGNRTQGRFHQIEIITLQEEVETLRALRSKILPAR